MNTSKCLPTLLFTIVPLVLWGQENIPIGTFRLHVSYHSIHDITFDGVSRTFAAAPHGILVVDRKLGETATYSKANGISGGTITSVEFDAGTGKLIVGYAEGYFDVVNEELIAVHFDPASTAIVSGSRKINTITVSGKLAYLATDYGVLVFDLVRQQVRETWRDLGISGAPLAVQHCVVVSDSVFLSTAQGVMAGRLSDNLQDFSRWKRYLQAPFGNRVGGLAAWRDTVYAAVDHTGLFKCVNGVWTQLSGVPADRYFSLQAAQVLMLSAASGVYQLNDAGAIERISSPLFAAPRFAIADGSGSHWIGDQETGLITNADGAYASLLPQCPANDTITQMRFADGKIFAVGGGPDENGLPLKRRGVVDIFDQGRWTPVPLPAKDLTDVIWDESTETLTAASYGFGVIEKRAGAEAVFYDDTNSTLQRSPLPAGGVLVTALAKVSDGMLALNYAANPALHQTDRAGEWAAHPLPVPAASYGAQMVVDAGGNVWIAVDAAHGGGLLVFNRSSGESRLLTEAENQGALPHQFVYSLCLDRADAMWIGTAAGVAYIANASAILQSPAGAVKPIADGRFVLREDAVTAIAVDGGNRKWFGTQRGIWLYNAAADEAIGHFTASNSVLPSDKITDLEINPQNGEVFMATETGLASYRSGATGERHESESVKIFPNPVNATFTGVVGISGTPTDAVVKVTDASGKLVWETTANGSTATWDLFDDRGRRVPSGVYIVFTVSADGKQREAGKFVVIN